MSALRAKAEKLLPPGWFGREGPAVPLVLPRLLRRPVRILSRVDWRLPRHFGLKATVGLFAVTGLTGTVMGGHVGTVLTNVTSEIGLGVAAIRISGQSETSELDVLDRMAMPPGASLATYDVDAARRAIEELPWVRQVSLRKLYPDTLQVTVVERTPFALWRRGELVSVVDRDGAVLTDHVSNRYAGLPLLVGQGAQRRVGEITAMIDAMPTLKPRIRASVLVSDRRWNLVLEGGTEILLPEAAPQEALARLVALDAGSGILSRDISRIDLRLSDRMVVKLTEAGLKSRQEAVKERQRIAKRRGGAA